MHGKSYTEYHARCWAESRTIDEIREEILSLTQKAKTHNFDWQEVGNATDTQTRINTLNDILEERWNT